MKTGIAKTTNLTKLSQAYGFLLSQQDEQMGLIWGQPGVGKTTCSRYIASQFDIALVTAMPNWSSFAMVNYLLNAVGSPQLRSMSAGLDKLIEIFSKRQQALFIDEADHLCEQSGLLEIIRAIHDHAEIPIVMIGMTGIYNKLAGRKLFIDRVQYFLELQGADLQDTQLIAEARCQIKIAQDLLAHIHNETKGNARLIKRSLAHIESMAIANGLEEIDLNQWGEQSLLPASAKAPRRRAS